MSLQVAQQPAPPQQSQQHEEQEADAEDHELWGNGYTCESNGLQGAVLCATSAPQNPLALGKDLVAAYVARPGQPVQHAQNLLQKVGNARTREQVFYESLDESGTPSIDLCDLAAAVVLLDKFPGAFPMGAAFVAEFGSTFTELDHVLALTPPADLGAAASVVPAYWRSFLRLFVQYDLPDQAFPLALQCVWEAVPDLAFEDDDLWWPSEEAFVQAPADVIAVAERRRDALIAKYDPERGAFEGESHADFTQYDYIASIPMMERNLKLQHWLSGGVPSPAGDERVEQFYAEYADKTTALDDPAALGGDDDVQFIDGFLGAAGEGQARVEAALGDGRLYKPALLYELYRSGEGDDVAGRMDRMRGAGDVDEGEGQTFTWGEVDSIQSLPALAYGRDQDDLELQDRRQTLEHRLANARLTPEATERLTREMEGLDRPGRPSPIRRGPDALEERLTTLKSIATVDATRRALQDIDPDAALDMDPAALEWLARNVDSNQARQQDELLGIGDDLRNEDIALQRRSLEELLLLCADTYQGPIAERRERILRQAASAMLASTPRFPWQMVHGGSGGLTLPPRLSGPMFRILQQTWKDMGHTDLPSFREALNSEHLLIGSAGLRDGAEVRDAHAAVVIAAHKTVGRGGYNGIAYLFQQIDHQSDVMHHAITVASFATGIPPSEFEVGRAVAMNALRGAEAGERSQGLERGVGEIARTTQDMGSMDAARVRDIVGSCVEFPGDKLELSLTLGASLKAKLKVFCAGIEGTAELSFHVAQGDTGWYTVLLSANADYKAFIGLGDPKKAYLGIGTHYGLEGHVGAYVPDLDGAVAHICQVILDVEDLLSGISEDLGQGPIDMTSLERADARQRRDWYQVVEGGGTFGVWGGGAAQVGQQGSDSSGDVGLFAGVDWIGAVGRYIPVKVEHDKEASFEGFDLPESEWTRFGEDYPDETDPTVRMSMKNRDFANILKTIWTAIGASRHDDPEAELTNPLIAGWVDILIARFGVVGPPEFVVRCIMGGSAPLRHLWPEESDNDAPTGHAHDQWGPTGAALLEALSTGGIDLTRPAAGQRAKFDALAEAPQIQKLVAGFASSAAPNTVALLMSLADGHLPKRWYSRRQRTVGIDIDLTGFFKLLGKFIGGGVSDVSVDIDWTDAETTGSAALWNRTLHNFSVTMEGTYDLVSLKNLSKLLPGEQKALAVALLGALVANQAQQQMITAAVAGMLTALVACSAEYLQIAEQLIKRDQLDLSVRFGANYEASHITDGDGDSELLYKRWTPMFGIQVGAEVDVDVFVAELSMSAKACAMLYTTLGGLFQEIGTGSPFFLQLAVTGNNPDYVQDLLDRFPNQLAETFDNVAAKNSLAALYPATVNGWLTRQGDEHPGFTTLLADGERRSRLGRYRGVAPSADHLAHTLETFGREQRALSGNPENPLAGLLEAGTG